MEEVFAPELYYTRASFLELLEANGTFTRISIASYLVSRHQVNHLSNSWDGNVVTDVLADPSTIALIIRLLFAKLCINLSLLLSLILFGTANPVGDEEASTTTNEASVKN